MTFDDGPDPVVTPAVIDCLAQFKARAVFFVVGHRICKAPEMLAWILENGHILGNHSYTHPLERRMSLREYAADLQRAQEEIYRVCGDRVWLHRPPLGVLSIATLLPAMKLGLTTIQWSCSSEDWRLRHEPDTVNSAEVAAANLSTAIRPRDIVLFHDEYEPTVSLLSKLLPALHDRGLRFDPAPHEFR